MILNNCPLGVTDKPSKLGTAFYVTCRGGCWRNVWYPHRPAGLQTHGSVLKGSDLGQYQINTRFPKENR